MRSQRKHLADHRGEPLSRRDDAAEKKAIGNELALARSKAAPKYRPVDLGMVCVKNGGITLNA